MELPGQLLAEAWLRKNSRQHTFGGLKLRVLGCCPKLPHSINLQVVDRLSIVEAGYQVQLVPSWAAVMKGTLLVGWGGT